MAENTAISWTHHTANPWWGCTEVHAGCDNCYARTFARRVGKPDGWEGVRYATRSIWSDLLKWDAAARNAGRIDRVFCGSMMDIFEKSMPLADWKGNQLAGAETGQLRDRYLREVVPATPNLMHLLLTKRPSNIVKMVPKEWLHSWPLNVMTGTSPVDQDTANTLIPQLARVPGPHFLSVEPMLGPVNLMSQRCCDCPIEVRDGDGWTSPAYVWKCCEEPVPLIDGIDWVIVGGESGPGARPMHPDWVRTLCAQCLAAGVPFHFKQWGEFSPAECTSSEFLAPAREHLGERIVGPNGFLAAFPELGLNTVMRRVGKKAAGRLLDGVTHDAFPLETTNG